MRPKVINLERNSIAGLIALCLTLLLSTGDAVADVVTPEVPMGRGASIWAGASTHERRRTVAWSKSRPSWVA